MFGIYVQFWLNFFGIFIKICIIYEFCFFNRFVFQIMVKVGREIFKCKLRTDELGLRMKYIENRESFVQFFQQRVIFSCLVLKSYFLDLVFKGFFFVIEVFFGYTLQVEFGLDFRFFQLQFKLIWVFFLGFFWYFLLVRV